MRLELRVEDWAFMSEYRDISAGLAARMALEKYGFRFSHSLGQNFILDDRVVDRIVRAADIQPDENVLEIGPGAGVMTRALAEAGARVTAVELDRSLEPVLRAVLGGTDRVRLVFGDALKLDMGELMEQKPYRVVANLPYYMTADVIVRMLTQPFKPGRVTVMVQKEAAERMMARRGGKTWCALAATVQYFGASRVLMEAPPELFTPPPHVDSRLMEIALYEKKPVEARDEAMMLRTIASCFAMRRKTLLNNLCASFCVPREKALDWLSQAGLDAMVRGEALELGQIAALSDVIGRA